MSESKSHLETLPVKSFKVAPGQVIGGLVYVMDKPLGIEEGMVGISVDSPGYRGFIKGQLSKLGTSKNFKNAYKKLLQDNQDFDKKEESEKIDILMRHSIIEKRRHGLSLNEIKKVFFSFGKYHELKGLQTYYANRGMGGLLFEEYKKQCGIKNNDHFATHINKLVNKNNPAYMVKQDGELVLGATGPGTRKILKTNTGKKLQILANPFVVLATGGLSALAFGVGLGLWRLHYLRNNTTTSVNSDAIVESLSTKLAEKRGLQVQGIDTIEGTYENLSPKIVTAVTWKTGCIDLSNKLAGGDNYDSVIVSWDKNKFPYKVLEIDGEEYTIRTTGKDKNDKPTGFEKISPEGIVSPATAEEYEKGQYISNDNIRGLGESLLTFLAMADNDGMGKVGQNKAIIPIDPPDGNYTQQFFGIDFGKAYKGPNPIVGTLKDDFSFENPQDFRKRFVNYSALYDNPLREKMKGVYLLAALRGKLPREVKEKIIADYRAHNDNTFADKLEQYPNSVGGVDSDLELIREEIKTYQESAENQKDLKKKDEYLQYVKRLEGILKIAEETDKAILTTFKKRMHLTPTQIDLLDNLEKLTAKKASTLSPDGTVKLNHIRVEREDRVEWQLEKNNEGNFDLKCKDTKDVDSIRKRLNNFLSNTELQMQNGKLCVLNLSHDQITKLSQQLNEETVANTLMLSYRSQADRNLFHENIRKVDSDQKPETVEKSASQTFLGTEPEPEPEPKSFVNQLQLNQSLPTSVFEETIKADGNLKTIKDFLSKDENKKACQINGALQEIKTGSFISQDGIAIPFKNTNKNNDLKGYISATKTNNLQYSVPKDYSNEDFLVTAKALFRIAIKNAEQNSVFDISKAPPERKDLIIQAFEEIKAEELKANPSRFDPKTIPKLIDETPKISIENQRQKK